jgi:capsular exopolysaccharide synthesis family protein
MTYLALGLIVGILLAFLLESLDTGLRSIAEIEGVTELPSLAIVPRAKRATPEQLATMTVVERNINVLTQPKSQFTEAFRSLRTALLLSSTTGREPKFILCTSATPSEGKTTAASNLAVILAQRGTKVLLIDADLRRPNMHHRFGLNGKLGLSTVLSGQTTLENSVQNVAEVPGLDILASGPVPPFPTEMLSSQTMIDLLHKAGEQYTYVVLDSPPVLSVTDGVLLSRQVDAVILVVRHGKSSKHIVRRGRDLLFRSGAPLAGIVLNAVDLNAPEYYGYYGYSGYSYSSLDPAGWDAKGESRSGSTGQSRRKKESRDDQ